MVEIKIKKDVGYLNIKGRKLYIGVYKIEKIPGIFIYEKNNTWVIAKEDEGINLHEGIFASKKQAVVAAILFLKNLDMQQSLTQLSKNSSFKKAIAKLNAATKLKKGKN